MPRFSDATVEQGQIQRILERVIWKDGDQAYLRIDDMVTTVDAHDIGALRERPWYFSPNIMGGYYVSARENGTTIYLHRVLTGAAAFSHKVDHVNGDTLDNRRANLRLTTNQKNMINRRGANANSKTGIRGVSVHRCRPSGLLYMARFHRPAGESYACRSFPFTPDGLIAAAQTVAGFLAGEVTADAHIPTPEEARATHARLCVAYADALANRKRRARSALVSV